MRRTVNRYWRVFSLGFIIAFVAYLFIRWDPDKVFTGVGIAIAGGVVLVVVAEIVRSRWLGEPDVTDVQR
ncbi:MAG: hypothetical protein WED87_03825 [Dehalococcoidia bacterium]